MTTMRYGIIITTGEPRTAAALAAEAETVGWDGVFTWDGIAIGSGDTWDPWVVMAAMAMTTSRVTLGAIVTPPSRRRPWKLAREALTIDHLSGGRLVLPVGLGALDDAAFGNVGEATGVRERAERLDEALDILDGLWGGASFGFEGRHYRFGPMTFRPVPVQRPRIPIWVVGAWPSERSMARAARWDGLIGQALTVGGRSGTWGPAEFAAAVAWIRDRRARDGRDGPYEFVVSDGSTPPDDATAARRAVEPWRDAGATWWIEADWEGATVDRLRRRIAAGPPR